MSPLAEFLKSLRLARRLSQRQFGLLIGLADSHVCIVENGARYAPKLSALSPWLGGLNLSDKDRSALLSAAEVSPQKLRIPPDSPPSAFRFIATLQDRWMDISEEEFNTLHRFVLANRQGLEGSPIRCETDSTESRQGGGLP